MKLEIKHIKKIKTENIKVQTSSGGRASIGDFMYELILCWVASSSQS